VQLHAVLERLVARGHEVQLLVSRFPGCATEQQLRGVPVRRQGAWWNANFALLAAAKRELRRQAYDVVLEDVNKIPFYTPLVTRLPLVVLVPHLFGATIFRETNPLFGSYLWLMERPLPWLFRRAWWIAISASTRTDLERRGVDPQRLQVVHCGLDFASYDLAAPPPRDPLPTLVHVGRLMRYKRADVAVRALAAVRRELPEARLLILGDGPERSRLEKLVRRLDLASAVEFHGHVPHRDKVRLLWTSHLLLNPSPKEGWGLTVVEANACGVPVVASRRPGLVDSVRHGETGLLVPFGDADAFAVAALSLLRDPERWRRMGENARAWARRFTWEEAALQTEAVLERAIEAHTAASPGAAVKRA
jgi:glycosyltransferase involved in cell wall biosynthesis